MKKNSRGFTLLEICVCFILFAILLESLWGFFSNTYAEFLQMDKQVMLNNEADAIQSFIKNYIRQEEKIKITTQDDSIIQVLTGTGNPSSDITGDLKSIEGDSSQLKIGTNTPPIARQGLLKLEYISGGTSKVVSDQIQNIKVTQKKDSDLVEFVCTLHKAGESNNRSKVTIRFIESLTYKERLIGATPAPGP